MRISLFLFLLSSLLCGSLSAMDGQPWESLLASLADEETGHVEPVQRAHELRRRNSKGKSKARRRKSITESIPKIQQQEPLINSTYSAILPLEIWHLIIDINNPDSLEEHTRMLVCLRLLNKDLYKMFSLAEMVNTLKNKSEYEQKDKNACLLLHSAAAQGDVKSIYRLIKIGVANAKNIRGLTALHLAVLHRQEESVDALTGANVLAQDASGVTPLHLAVASEQSDLLKSFNWSMKNKKLNDEIVTILCSPSAAIGALKLLGKNNEQEWSLHDAAAQGDVNTIRRLLERGADINVPDRGRWTPLHYAAHKGHVVCMQYLLDVGADSNRKTKSGMTPLHMAVVHNQRACVHALIQAGADLDAQNKFGETPLHVAVDCADASYVQTLLDAGAQPDIECIPKGLKGHLYTPLHRALDNKRVACARLLINAGATFKYRRGECSFGRKADTWLKACDDEGFDDARSKLHLAAMWGRAKLICTLVQQGADVNVCNRYGETPLYYAAAVGEKEAAQVLLEQGADPDVKNNFIWADTPADLAYRRGNSEVGNLIEHWDDDNLPKQVYKLWERISCVLWG